MADIGSSQTREAWVLAWAVLQTSKEEAPSSTKSGPTQGKAAPACSAGPDVTWDPSELVLTWASFSGDSSCPPPMRGRVSQHSTPVSGPRKTGFHAAYLLGDLGSGGRMTIHIPPTPK